jgi:hypothetical protein
LPNNKRSIFVKILQKIPEKSPLVFLLKNQLKIRLSSVYRVKFAPFLHFISIRNFMQQRPLRGFTYALIASMTWGTLPIAVQPLLKIIDAETLVWYRFLIAGL